MTPRGRGWEGGRGEGNGARPRAGDGHAGRARRVGRMPWACQRRRVGVCDGSRAGVAAEAGDGASAGGRPMAMLTLAKVGQSRQTASGRCKNGRMLKAPYLALE